MPDVVISRSVDLRQLLLTRVDFVGSLLGGITSNIADQDGSIVHCVKVRPRSKSNIDAKLTKLSELPVGDNERPKRPQALQSLVSMLLGRLRIDRCTR